MSSSPSSSAPSSLTYMNNVMSRFGHHLSPHQRHHFTSRMIPQLENASSPTTTNPLYPSFSPLRKEKGQEGQKKSPSSWGFILRHSLFANKWAPYSMHSTIYVKTSKKTKKQKNQAISYDCACRLPLSWHMSHNRFLIREPTHLPKTFPECSNADSCKQWENVSAIPVPYR